ncbi:MAG: hypothetical protein LBI99_10895, partial [Propionibacteriaceae bacterium]|nr:hypothetical protein [Propionibacteriaceae bacterium]
MKKTRLAALIAATALLASALGACSGPAQPTDNGGGAETTNWPKDCASIQIFLATSAGGASDLTY